MSVSFFYNLFKTMALGQFDLLVIPENFSGVKTFSLIRTFGEDLEPQGECEEQHPYSRRGVAADVCVAPWHHAPL